MDIRLTGKNVLVTGASRGIGAAIARAFGAAGARVAVHGSSSMSAAAAVASECGGESFAVAQDLSEPLGGALLWDAVVERMGSVDVLVNNAAVALEMGPSLSDGDWVRAWDRTMAVNVRAAELLARRAALHFASRGGGRMVHIASRAAHRGDTPDYITYAASKGALVAISKSIARGYGRQGVCSFVIAPGFVRTDMAQDFIDAYGEDYVASDIALGTLTEPSDIAPMAVFLASGLADHATGTTVDINGASYVR